MQTFYLAMLPMTSTRIVVQQISKTLDPRRGALRREHRYCNFIGWEMPWYFAQDSLDTCWLGVGRA